MAISLNKFELYLPQLKVSFCPPDQRRSPPPLPSAAAAAVAAAHPALVPERFTTNWRRTEERTSRNASNSSRGNCQLRRTIKSARISPYWAPQLGIYRWVDMPLHILFSYAIGAESFGQGPESILRRMLTKSLLQSLPLSCRVGTTFFFHSPLISRHLGIQSFLTLVFCHTGHPSFLISFTQKLCNWLSFYCQWRIKVGR